MTQPPPRLALRPLRPEDCERLLAWIDSADALWQWAGIRSFSWPLDRGQLLRDLEAHRDCGGLFAAVDPVGGEMVGHVRIDVQPNHRFGLIGRVAIAPERRGRGLGTALMHAIVRHGFEELGLHRLQLAVYTFNTAAIACYLGVGFVVEGELRDAALGSGGYWTALSMALLENDHRRSLGDADEDAGGIRLAGLHDAEAIAALLTQLGHPHEPAGASQRLLDWAVDPQGAVLVAEAAGGVAGFVAVHELRRFQRPGMVAHVVALGVDPRQRGADVRQQLLRGAERWAAQRGCIDLEVEIPRDGRAAECPPAD